MQFITIWTYMLLENGIRKRVSSVSREVKTKFSSKS